jgi:hypothetical protein
MIPRVDISKSSKQQNFWVVTMWIADELFNYKYPFQLPDFFKDKLNENNLRLIRYFYQIFSSSSSVEKRVFKAV